MNILKSAILTACLATASAGMADSAPKYIFYCIGDGMGITTVMNASHFAREVLGDTVPMFMTSMPIASLSTTWSSSSNVTNSSAAGTALASGFKTKNDMLGMNPDTIAVTSMAEILFDKGYGIGLVSTVAIDDATPAAFYAHQPNRHMYREIGRELAESGFQYAAGAGLRAITDKNGHPTGLLEEFAANDMRIVHGIDSISGEESRLLVLSPFTDRPWNAGYTIDSIGGALTLQDMTRAGIQHLSRVSPDRFFMMIEGGNIDHAGHANDAATAIVETLNFDRTIGILLDFYKQHPDETLIVVTADHDTGGMSVGNNTTAYATNFAALAGQKISKETFSDYCLEILNSGKPYTWEDMKDYLTENLGLWSAAPLNESETDSLRAEFEHIFIDRDNVPDQQTLYANFNAFAKSVFAILNDKAGIAWASEKHTGAPVPVFAIGTGSEKLTGMPDNTDIPRAIMTTVGYPLD